MCIRDSEKCCCVKTGVGANVVLLKFRDYVLAVVRFVGDCSNIRINPVNLPTGALPSNLQTGSTVENDHDISTQCFRLLCLSYAQTFAGRCHQHDGNNAPRNPEHCEECPKLVGPQGAENVADEIPENHCSLDEFTRSS